MGVAISILTYEFYHYALSRKMTQAALAFNDSCDWPLRPFDGCMMYTDIDLEYRSHLSTTYI